MIPMFSILEYARSFLMSFPLWRRVHQAGKILNHNDNYQTPPDRSGLEYPEEYFIIIKIPVLIMTPDMIAEI